MTVWLPTFLVHSTLWCATAWLFLRAFPKAHARLRETIWHIALAASLITPTVHTVASPDTALWRVPIPSAIVGREHATEGEHDREKETASGALPPGERTHGEEDAANPSWQAAAGILWIALAGGLLALYVLRLEKLRRSLHDRQPVADPRASCALAELGRKVALDPPPRLTESHNLGSPVALGAGTRREICVPVRALHELDEDEFRALIGHEIAHHLRRDTIRLAILNVLQAVFFFQPLFRLAAREVRLAAEELCDDWAASQFADRLAMASCLAEVARWVARPDRRSPVPCIGRRRSRLELRVRRLMDEHRALRAQSRPLWRLGAVGLLMLAPLFAPAVVPGSEVSHDDRRAVESALTPEHDRLREH